MTYKKTAMVLTLAAATMACGWRRTPVPVLADSESIAALVGNWVGEYSSSETGRSGSITFDLASAKDTAYGDVVMVPRVQAAQFPIQGRPETAGPRPQAASEPLRIRFVRLEGGRISGTLAPYIDPDCGCRVVTTFDGRFINPNTIEGKYTTRGSELYHETASGRWKVTRDNPKTTIP
jgi:hypothetical protein